MADEERIASCIRGYHIYKTVWKARIGEVLSCEREPTNAIDRYAVSVFKGSFDKKTTIIPDGFL